MKFPAINREDIKKGDYLDILNGMKAKLEDVFWKSARDVKDGEGIALFFTLKRFNKDGGIPISDRNTKAYREWREAVFLRDKYTCVKCCVPGLRIQADHIKPYYKNASERLLVSNGQTLCLECHARKHPHIGFAGYGKSRNPLVKTNG